jgi:hypothetical protein
MTRKLKYLYTGYITGEKNTLSLGPFFCEKLYVMENNVCQDIKTKLLPFVEDIWEKIEINEFTPVKELVWMGNNASLALGTTGDNTIVEIYIRRFQQPYY